jgi:hypothetical protein
MDPIKQQSFGFQWLTFEDTQLDTEQVRRLETDFRRRTGFKPDDLAGTPVTALCAPKDEGLEVQRCAE